LKRLRGAGAWAGRLTAGGVCAAMLMAAGTAQAVDSTQAVAGAARAAAASQPAALRPSADQATAPPPDWSLAARWSLQAGPAGGHTLAARDQLLADAEQLLALGQAPSAQDTLDRAALMLHAPDTEASLVRAYMQAGEYRRALAFGAHAAGAHRREWPAGQALYVWLLQAGGQTLVARRMLDEALELAPDDAALRLAQTQLQQSWPLASGALLQPPLRTAPVAVAPAPAALPPGLAVVGSAVLLDGGRAALLPLALLAPGPAASGADARETVWLRNGLGQASAAWLEQSDTALGVAVLRLDQPLPAPDWQSAPRAPFGGSPGSLVEYGVDGRGETAWPLLRQGFFARQSDGGPRPLGIDAPPGPRGGPVFDQAGRLAGIALASTAAAPAGGAAAAVREPDRLLSLAQLAVRHAALLPPPAPAGPAPRVEIDAVYETALRATLQVLLPR